MTIKFTHYLLESVKLLKLGCAVLEIWFCSRQPLGGY